MLRESFDDRLHHLSAFVDVSILATTKQHRYLNFVVVLQKPDRFFDFEADVVLTSFGANTNFFQLGLMRFVFGLTLLLFVIEFSKVHNPTDWRFRIAGHFDQVKPRFTSLFQSVIGWNYA